MSLINLAKPTEHRDYRCAVHALQTSWTTPRKILALAFLLWVSSAPVNAQQEEPQAVTLTDEGREWVEQTLKGLSLEEKVGQMLVLRYFADYPSFDGIEYKQLRDQLQKYGIGSVIFGAHIRRQGLVRCSPLDAARVANQLQSAGGEDIVFRCLRRAVRQLVD